MIQNADLLSELLTCGDFFSDNTNLMGGGVDFQTGIPHEDEALALLEQQLLQAIESPACNSDHDLFGGMDLDLTTANCSNLTSTTLLDCIPELDMGFLEKDFFSDCFNLQQLANNSSTAAAAHPSSSANTVNSSYNSCSSTAHIGSSSATNKNATAAPPPTASRSKKPLEERRDILARKKAKPGESARPRPKDRQLIQDRVKELREIVPNGSKVIHSFINNLIITFNSCTYSLQIQCSIDALLNRTINHMIYLQNVTNYAEKIKQVDGTKVRKYVHTYLQCMFVLNQYTSSR